jgi:prolyl-tRNA editing enzyme YbaK/EbsC (Cys-tRNA(Pro) deacylase)
VVGRSADEVGIATDPSKREAIARPRDRATLPAPSAAARTRAAGCRRDVSANRTNTNMTAALHDAVRAALDGAGVQYDVLECAPEYADTAAYCEHYQIDLANTANTIVVAAKTDPIRYAACVVQATTKLDVNKRVTAVMGAKRASFANADQTLALTGMMIGGVTAFGLPAGLPIYVDANLMTRPWVIFGGGNRSSKVRLVPAELRKLPGIEIVDGLAVPKA